MNDKMLKSTGENEAMVRDVDLVAEVRNELGGGSRLPAHSPMHRAVVDDVVDEADALLRTYGLLLYVLEDVVDVEEEVVPEHPVVDALVALRQDSRLVTKTFAQTRWAGQIDRWAHHGTDVDVSATVDVSECLATQVRETEGGRPWRRDRAFSYQELTTTRAHRALLLVEMMRARGFLRGLSKGE